MEADTSKPLYVEDIERSVLSVMMQTDTDNDYITQAIGLGVTEDHFFKRIHKQMFNYIKADAEKDLYPDLVRYGVEWPKSEELKYATVHEITEVYTYQLIPDHFESHINILNKFLAYRKAYDLSSSIRYKIEHREEISDITAKIEDVKSEMIHAIDTNKGTVGAEEACKLFAERYKELAISKELPGIKTGQPLIDKVTGGMKPKEFWVYCAFPSGGKSVQGVEAICQTILMGGNPLYYTLEMDAAEVMNRIVCRLANLHMPKLTDPANNPSTAVEKQRIKEALEMVKKSNLVIFDEPNQKWSTIKAHAIKQNDLLGNIDSIVIDYIQLLEPETQSMSRRETIEKASADMKQLAKRLSCPVVTMAQMEDGGKIKHSRAPGEDGNIVMTIQDRGECEHGIYVNKNRNAERGMLLPLVLDGKNQTFVSK